MDFMFRQLFNRLFIVSPAFIRVFVKGLPQRIEESKYR